VHPVVVLGKHDTGLPWPVSQGPPAYLAACDGKPGHRHREPRGIWPAHRYTSCHAQRHGGHRRLHQWSCAYPEADGGRTWTRAW